MWIEYRHKWAYGIDSTPNYVRIPEEDELKEMGYDDPGDYIHHETNIMSDNEYTDKYRGIDYDIVEVPPIDFLVNKIKSHVDHLEWHGKQLKYFKKLLDNTGYINKEEFSV